MQVNFLSYPSTAATPVPRPPTHPPLVLVGAPPPRPPLMVRKEAGHNGFSGGGVKGEESPPNGAAPEYRCHPRHEAAA